MKSRVFLLAILLVLIMPSGVRHVSATASGVFLQQTWGGDSKDEGRGIALDQSGNIYVTGRTDSFGASNASIFILKYNTAGQLLWQKTWGGNGMDFGEDVIVDSLGNVYVAGGTYSYGTGGNGDALLLKIAPNGTLLWQQTWGGNRQDWANRLALDSSGNIYLAGFTFSFGPGAPSNPNALLLKYNSNGSLLWQRVLGGSPPTDLGGVRVDNSGNIYVAGYYYISGPTQRVILISKLNSTGYPIWSKTWGPPGDGVATRLAFDPSGNVLITGYNGVGQGSDQALLLKLDSSGNLLWQRSWGGYGQDLAYSLAVDSTGNSIITGRTWSFGSTPQVFLTEFGASGDLLSQYGWGGGYDDGRAVALDTQGSLFVTGIVNEPPPYHLNPLAGFASVLSFSTVSIPLPVNVTSVAASSTGPSLKTPPGLTTYAGGSDAFLLGFNIPSPGSVTFLTTQGIGYILFNGTFYSNDQTNMYPGGIYTIAAIPPYGYAFTGWNTTGNVTVTNNTDNPTTALVGGSGSLIAKFTQLPPGLLDPVTLMLPTTLAITLMSAILVFLWRKNTSRRRMLQR